MTVTDRFEFVLGVVEALVVGPAAGADVRLHPLRTGALPTDPVRFVQVAKQVYADLEARQLSVKGELHPGVRTAFELLGSHRVSVAVTGIDGVGADIAVLAVTDGRRALGVTQDPKSDDLLFSLFADDDLVEVVTGVLPPAPAASGSARTVHRGAAREVSALTARRMAEAAEDEEETDAFGNIEVNAVVRPGRRPTRRTAQQQQPQQGDTLERAMAGPRLGGGHLVVTGWGRHGERIAGEPMSWLDSAEGRYLVRTTTGAGGELAADYVPAARGDVARAVREAIAAVY